MRSVNSQDSLASTINIACATVAPIGGFILSVVAIPSTSMHQKSVLLFSACHERYSNAVRISQMSHNLFSNILTMRYPPDSGLDSEASDDSRGKG